MLLGTTGAWLVWLVAQAFASPTLSALSALLPIMATALLIRKLTHPDTSGASAERLASTSSMPCWRLSLGDASPVLIPLNAGAERVHALLESIAITDWRSLIASNTPLLAGGADHPLGSWSLNPLLALDDQRQQWLLVASPVLEDVTSQRTIDSLSRTISDALSCSVHVLYRLDYKRRAYEYISPVAARVCGVPLETLHADEGLTALLERVPPEDLQRNREHIRVAVEQSTRQHADCNLEYRVRDHKGRTRWFRDSLRILLDEAGDIAHLTGAILEITDTRMANEHFRVTLHSIGDAVLTTDAHGRVSLLNPPAEALTGWSQAEALGKPADLVLRMRRADDDSPLPCPVSDVLKSGATRRSEVPLNLERRDGNRIAITESAAPIFASADGATQGVVVVIRDERQARESVRRLHESESRYRTLVESSPVGIFHYDPALRITFLNQRFAEILGSTQYELINTPLATLADQSFMPTIRAAIQGQPGRYEGEFLPAGGSTPMRLSMRTAPALGVAGEVVGGVAIVEDNTARYEAEHKLRESETRYALAMRGTNEGLWDWNPLSKDLFLSSRLMVLLGEPAESVRTTSDAWLARLHPDDREIYYTRMVAHLKGETNHFEFEFRLGTHNGDYRWFRSRGVAQRDDTGTAYRMVGSIGDITARKRAQMQLNNELTFSRTLVDSLPVGLCVTRRDGSITLINQSLSRMVGPVAKDLRELKCVDLVIENDRPLIAQRLERAFDDGMAWAETALVASSGAPTPVHWLVRRVKLYDSDQLLCIASDISDRKRAEAQMRNLNRELELRVEDRTQQLAAAVKELEAFSYSVSHDLRAPLRAIDGYSRIIREDFKAAFDDEAHTLFDRMLAAVARMSELIDDLLELSRVSRRPLKRRPIDMSALASGVIDNLRHADPTREVTVEIEPGMEVVADESLLKIAIENLIGNAWKFTAKAPDARIRFYSQSADDETSYCVEDNGAGFDMRYIDKLFGAFQRLHTDRDFDGTGIGLATVERIILRHGGKVSAVGEPDQGATFTFSLGESDPSETRGRTLFEREGQISDAS